jgi:uncharacterized phage-associated protein
MALHPLAAARRVCDARKWLATNLEVNKVLYLAHMLALGRSAGERPLVAEHFQAWDYGPVLPSVYHHAKMFGSKPVKDIFWGVSSATGEDAAVLDEAIEATKDLTPGRLVAITHWDQGAWAAHYRPGARGIVIPDAAILAEYRKRVAPAAA